MSSDLRTRIKAAIEAALSGESVAPYQGELLRVAALGIALEKDEHIPEYLERCRSIFHTVNNIDLSRWTSGLSSRDLLDFLSGTVKKLVYFEPPAMGLPVPPMIPRASAGDNRLLLVFGCLVAYPDDPEKKIFEVATVVTAREACDEELQRRGSKLKNYVLKFLGLVHLEKDLPTSDYSRLVDDVRPGNWQELANQLLIPESDGRSEVDSLIGFVLGHEVTAHREHSMKDSFLAALEGGLDFLPNKVKGKIIDQIRRDQAQKRQPRHDGRKDDLFTEQPSEELEMGALMKSIEAAAPRLKEAYGPQADKVIAVIVRSAGNKPNQEKVAKAIGISDRQFREYLSRMRKNPKLIMDLLST